MSQQQDTSFFVGKDGNRLAYSRVRGEGWLILWLGGFASDRKGSKAQALEQAARDNGWSYLGFDYFAHGESDGAWTDATVGLWIENVLEVVDSLTRAPLVVVGSSMGGWLLMHLLKMRPERVAAAGFIAPAPDFTHQLMLPALDPEARHELTRDGYLTLKGYDRPLTLSQAFFDEAEAHQVLSETIPFDGKVRILHGTNDDVVPWQHGMRVMETIRSPDMTMTLIKNGDHRLSRPQDISMIIEMVKDLRA
jgi:pimeloyl-ACP methyl ester carboxylesterase